MQCHNMRTQSLRRLKIIFNLNSAAYYERLGFKGGCFLTKLEQFGWFHMMSKTFFFFIFFFWAIEWRPSSGCHTARCSFVFPDSHPWGSMQQHNTTPAHNSTTSGSTSHTRMVGPLAKCIHTYKVSKPTWCTNHFSHWTREHHNLYACSMFTHHCPGLLSLCYRITEDSVLENTEPFWRIPCEIQSVTRVKTWSWHHLRVNLSSFYCFLLYLCILNGSCWQILSKSVWFKVIVEACELSHGLSL